MFQNVTDQSLVRRFLITLGAIVVAMPLLGWCTYQCVTSMFNMPPHWVPTSHEERRKFDWFCEHFESEAIIVISWPGCTVDDPRLLQLEQELTNPQDPAARQQHQQLYARVITGYTVMRQLMDEPLELSRDEAVARLASVLIGPDRMTSCAVIVLTDAGGYARTEAVARLLDVAEATCGLDRDQFRLAGPPVDGVAIDRASTDTLRWFIAPSALVSLLMCWYCLRSWRYAVLIMVAAGFVEALVLAIIYLSGEPMNAILILMPPLVFVLTVSAGVHLVNYYFDDVRHTGVQGAARRAMLVGWGPSVLAALTTGIGLCSLMVSDIAPIRQFGSVSSAGIAVGLASMLLLLPGVMTRWPRTTTVRHVRRYAAVPRGIRILAEIVIRHALVITMAAIVVTAGLGYGLLKIETSVRMRDFFTPHDRVLRDYDWLENNVGPMVPVEVLVHFPSDTPVNFLKRVELVRAIGYEVDSLDSLGGVMSAATFAPYSPQGWSFRAVLQREAMSDQLEERKQQFVDLSYLAETDGQQIWRVSARAAAMSDVDYHQLLDRIKQHVEPLVAQWREAHTVNDKVPHVSLSYTGAMPLIYQTQRILLHDLFSSFFTAFGVVAVVMMLVLRSAPAGLVAMIPNLFPTAIVLGFMGWLRVPIDIGTVMTASIALGIAVVDTLHFLTWFRRERTQGRSTVSALRLTYRHCAVAMIYTSLICGVGMLMFIFSGFVPTQRFAWMVFLLLMAALAGDLIILPALLAGPLGRVFWKKRATT